MRDGKDWTFEWWRHEESNLDYVSNQECVLSKHLVFTLKLNVKEEVKFFKIKEREREREIRLEKEIKCMDIFCMGNVENSPEQITRILNYEQIKNTRHEMNSWKEEIRIASKVALPRLSHTYTKE